MPEDKHHVYGPIDMPDVEVLWQGSWCPGEARMRTLLKNGTYEYNVQYRRPGELTSHLDTFPEDQVRKDTVDRSQKRG